MLMACVLKHGGDFNADHVERLMQSAWAHHKINWIAFCEETLTLHNDWPKWWAKMEIFNADSVPGDLLYFDLDTIINGSLDRILEACTGDVPIILTDFLRPGGLQSSMMYLPESARRRTWEAFLAGPPEKIMERFERGGDQQFLETLWLNDAIRWQDIPGLDGQIVSYKRDCQQGVPPDARVIIFHGLPRPWDTPLWDKAA